MWLFYLFAALVLAQGALSLRGGLRYLAYVRREMSAGESDYAPFAAVIVPCRGLDQGLRDNLAALFHQRYPAYEILFVVDDPGDPARSVIEAVRRDFASRKGVGSRVVVAGRSVATGQKVHNLRAGTQHVSPESEVLVFADSDTAPREDWLRSLIGPLRDERIGAATGYRWFFPVRGGLPSYLRAVWNASVAGALGENRQRNFCWGGSTAIRRATFNQLNMLDLWKGTLSDDYALTRAIHRAGLQVHFVPNCLTASHEDCTFAQLIEFTTRQIKITRVYAPRLWQIVLWTNLLFGLVFFGGIALAAARVALGLPYAGPLAVVAGIYALGATKAYLRLRAVALPLAPYAARLRRGAPAFLLLWPLASLIYLWNALAAAASRRITWRGITYELKSAEETVIISGSQPDETPEMERASHAQ
jgi:cellulose synthase/poly-beta-1,6-N-acetylglucosamine synthase-like glycosyltransferase